MSTSLRSPAAIAWDTHIEVHYDLKAEVTARANRVRSIYKRVQLTCFASISCLAVLANAGSPVEAADHAVQPMLLAAGCGVMLALHLLGHMHSAVRAMRWGFSASSLQRIYKAQVAHRNSCGSLICINCNHALPAESASDKRESKWTAGIQHGSASCPHCGFTLWPKCSRLEQLAAKSSVALSTCSSDLRDSR